MLNIVNLICNESKETLISSTLITGKLELFETESIKIINTKMADLAVYSY